MSTSGISIVEDDIELRNKIGPKIESQENKTMSHLDDICTRWISYSPFVIISSINRNGDMDTSPKGGAKGFVSVLNKKNIIIPDYSGNRRADTLTNIISYGKVSLLFIAPPAIEVVRVTGDAKVIDDKDVLKTFSSEEGTPKLGVLVEVKEVFFHCGKALINSQLWSQNSWSQRENIPTYAQALKVHANLDDSLETITQEISIHHYGTSL